MLHEFIEGVLPASEELFDLLLVFLHPLHQIFLFFGFLLPPLLCFQVHIASLSVSEVFLVNAFTQLSCCLLGRDGDFSPVYILDSRQVLGCTKIPVSSKAWYFPALGIEHLGVFDGTVVISSQLFDAYLPIIQLTQQFVDVVIKGANLVLRACSILYFFDFFDDIGGDLFPPFFALIEIGNLSNVAYTFGSLIVLFVDQGAFHGPPPVQHALCLLAVTGHSSVI